jgi:hypothetical protein
LLHSGRRIHAILGGMFLNELHIAGIWTADTLVEAIRAADEDLAVACTSGLKAFEVGDYWTATHVLVPQLERAVRDVAMLVSASVLRVVTNQSLEMASLDKMLGDERTIQALSPRVAKAFVEIFTDQSGMNVRNTTAHGLYPAGSDLRIEAYFAIMGILTAAFTLGVVKEQARG